MNGSVSATPLRINSARPASVADTSRGGSFASGGIRSVTRVITPCPVCGRIRHRGTTIATLFATHVVRGPGCWVWMGARTAKGYGTVHEDGRSRYAHRLAWEEVNGPIPDGLQACHHCDNPPCVRPDHLFLGTPADNTHDMMAKGRARGGRAVGAPHPTTKLTPASVREIRRRRDSGESVWSLAREFDVDRHVISRVALRRIWTHVPEEIR